MADKANIYAALIAAQKEMTAAKKEAANPHFRMKYADLTSVMDACKVALHNNGFALLQPVGSDDSGHWVETILQHESGEKLSCKVPLIFGRKDMQGFGSAMTYARRYGLMTMAGIAPEDDDGEGAKGNGNNAQANNPNRTKTPPPQPDPEKPAAATIAAAQQMLEGATNTADLKSKWAMLPPAVRVVPSVFDAKETRKAQIMAGDPESILDDKINY